MASHRFIGGRERGLDSLRRTPVSSPYMSRVIGALVLACAAAMGCSSAPHPNEMAPTAKPEAPAQARPDGASAKPPAPTPIPAPAPAAPRPAPVSVASEGIAARINNEIITWKDVKEALKEIKAADLTIELQKSKLREMAEERMFLQ